MATITLEEKHLHLIQKALDFYSRVGSGQFDKIKDHPTFEKHLHREFALGNGEFKVGDKTVRGEVVEVCPDGSWIKTKGLWNNGEEIRKWTDIDNIEYSTDYDKYHTVRDNVDDILYEARNLLYNDNSIGKNGGWGIYNENIDESCREAFDMIQIIRHEFWKKNPNRTYWVDSSIHLTSKQNSNIKVKL